MIEQSPPSDDLLAPDLALRIDQLCDRFEADWRSGRRPAIEKYLDGLADREREELFRELLLVELAYAGLRGEPPLVGDYQNRFPAQADLVRQVFDEIASGGALLDRPEAEPIGSDFIGKYRVVERLSAGGNLDVCRAIDPQLPGRDVVIKWAKHSPSPARQAQLLAEGRILARLEDPGLVRVCDVGLFEGRPFLVFEYVAGRSLDQRLKQGPLPFREAAALVAQLAGTLDRVHRHGVCHRDVKPATVLIDTAGRPRLLDFGLAIMAGDVPADPSDVFGLGNLLYELIAGQSPSHNGRLPQQLNPQLPRALEKICLRAMAVDPARRYPSAAHLERALHGYLRRPIWIMAGLLAGGGLAAAVILALALGRTGGNATSTDPAANPTSPIAANLGGDLVLRVWSKAKQGVRIEESVPVLTGERVQVEVQLSQQAYVYLLWHDSQGKVRTIHPRPKPDEMIGPRQFLRIPEEANRSHPVDGPSGLETVLLLVRSTPLPESVKLEELCARLPAAPLRNKREVAWRGFDLGQPVAAINRGQHRGIKLESEAIDQPLLHLMEKLRPHFELVRIVRFAHQGDPPSP